MVLLPLQAAAWGRMAVCAETVPLAHPAMAAMANCHDMTMQAQPAVGDMPSHPRPEQATCWIGSICIATVAAFAVTTQYPIAFVEGDNPTDPAVIALYQSIILDGLQRPPAAL